MVILAYPNPNNDYKLYTDASELSIGARLSQIVFDQKHKKEVEKNDFDPIS